MQFAEVKPRDYFLILELKFLIITIQYKQHYFLHL